jgi:oligopeptide transport system substrate-binding protein
MMELTRRQTLATGLAGLTGLTVAACSGRTGAPDNLLRVAIETEPDSLDPLRGQFASAALLYKQLHAPLTEYAPSGGLAPGLALTWRSEDARVWRFTLRPDLVWSDGAPLTADDVVWTARRAVDPTTGFADLGDFFAVIGAREALAGERHPDTIAVSAPDPRTVVFELDRPVGNFPVLMREFYPLPRHQVEAYPDDWIRPEHWVSAGPYLLDRYEALSLQLVKNPRFPAVDSVKVNAISVDVIDTPSARARRFRAGDYDLAERPPTDQIGFLRETVGDRLHAYPAPILTYLKLNCAQPYLSDPRVRRALSLGLDRAFLNTHFFNDEAQSSDTVIPRQGDAYTPPRPDPERARALLAEAGFTAQSPLRLTVRATAGDRDRLAIALLDDWSQIGVEGELLASYPLDLYQAVDAGDFDVALARFDRGLKSDPDFMLQPFSRNGFADNTNWSGAARETFDALMADAYAMIDPAERAAQFRRAEAIFLEAMPNIPLLHERAYWLVSDRTRTPDDIQPQLWRDLALR